MNICFSILLLQQLISPANPVKVHVAAKTEGGFVESSRLPDSVRDISAALSKNKNVALAETKEDAEIIVEVVSSGLVNVTPSTETKVRKGVLGGVNATTTSKPETLPNITAILTVRGSDYSKELSITRQMFWKDLAKNIANQVGDWVKVNGGNLRQKPKP